MQEADALLQFIQTLKPCVLGSLYWGSVLTNRRQLVTHALHLGSYFCPVSYATNTMYSSK